MSGEPDRREMKAHTEVGWCIFLLRSWISFCLSFLYPMLTCYVLTLLDPNVSETPSDWCFKWEGWWMIPCRVNITESFLKTAYKSGWGMHSNWAAYILWAFITIRPWHIAWFLFGFFLPSYPSVFVFSLGMTTQLHTSPLILRYFVPMQ